VTFGPRRPRVDETTGIVSPFLTAMYYTFIEITGHEIIELFDYFSHDFLMLLVSNLFYSYLSHFFYDYSSEKKFYFISYQLFYYSTETLFFEVPLSY
jgi:hypothetical protein